LIVGKHPSCVTVYKVINDYEARKVALRKRHPGADIDHQVVQTTEEDIKITHSNQVWQTDHTQLDVLVEEKDIEDQNSGETPEVIKDKSGTPMRPYLTIVMDSFSGCIVGYYLGFEAANSQRVALALRQSILPKANFPYPLQKEWQQYGIPEYIVTDRAKEFKSSHVKQVTEQLDIKWRFRAFPSAGGLVETIFNQGNNEVLKAMPGYTGSNTQERPVNAEKHACMTLDELEGELVKYFVDHYNQHTYPKVKHDPQFKVLTRTRRWKAGLLNQPEVMAERELDICLLKQKHNPKVMKYGCIQFNNLIYEGDCLKDNDEITEISIRYDPRNIVALLAYTKTAEGKASEFLGVLKARHFQYEQLSLEELKWICRKLRQQAKEIDNTSILNERYNQLNFVEQKRHQKRKRRKQAQHKREQVNNQSTVTEIFPQNAPETETTQSATHQSTAKINKDQTAPSRPRRGRSSGLVANIQNWQDYCEENW
jgi:putative transposase